MRTAIFGACLGLCLLFGGAGSVRAAAVHPAVATDLTGGGVTRVAEAPAEASNEVLHIEPPRLLFFGGGLLAGLLWVAPALEVSELFGAVLGVVGSEYLYQKVYKSYESSAH